MGAFNRIGRSRIVTDINNLPADVDLTGGDPVDDGPTTEEASADLAQTPFEPLPEAADLPTDVRDGEAGQVPPTP
jgi:hypothetical protein